MSVDQFRRRTSKLEIPPKVYELYDEVVKACTACRELVKQYPRSKISGIRADAFGDTVGVDLCFPVIFGDRVTVFVAVDLATSLTFCQQIPDNTVASIQSAILDLIDNWHLTPKRVVSDMEFVNSSQWRQFWARYNITPVPTGSYTPWPNRAERVVQILKRIILVLAAGVAADPDLRLTTVAQICKRAATARNEMFLREGVTPLMLAFGRQETNPLDIEIARPPQLVAQDLPKTVRDNEKLRTLAMEAYLKAKQSEDLKHDLATRLAPVAKDLRIGQRVMFFETTKANKVGTWGNWVPGRIVALQGGMVLLDTGTTIIRVNLTKLRTDLTDLEEIKLDEPEAPEILPNEPEQPPAAGEQPPKRRLIGKQTAPLRIITRDALEPRDLWDENPPVIAEDLVDVIPQGGGGSSSSTGENFVHSCERAMTYFLEHDKGKTNLLELFAGDAGISAATDARGLRCSKTIDLRTGTDLNTKEGQRQAWKKIFEQQPDVIFMAPVCAPWSLWSNMLPKWKQLLNRRRALPMVQFCIAVAWYQLQKGKWFMIENPQGSKMWDLDEMVALAKANGVSWGTLDQCQYGLQDPGNGKPYLKPTCLLHNFDPDLAQFLWRRCARTHDHQVIEGATLGKNRSAHAQIYPLRLCRAIARLFTLQLQRKSACHYSVPLDLTILDDLEGDASGGLLSLSSDVSICDQAWSTTVEPNIRLYLTGTRPKTYKTLENFLSDSLAVRVLDTKIKHMMSLADALPRGHVIDLTQSKTKREYELATLVQHFRAKYMPNQHFSRAIVSRGIIADLGEDTNGLMVLWNKKDTERNIRIAQLPFHDILDKQVDVSAYTFIWLCNPFDSVPDEPEPEDAELDDQMPPAPPPAPPDQPHEPPAPPAGPAPPPMDLQLPPRNQDLLDRPPSPRPPAQHRPGDSPNDPRTPKRFSPSRPSRSAGPPVNPNRCAPLPPSPKGPRPSPGTPLNPPNPMTTPVPETPSDSSPSVFRLDEEDEQIRRGLDPQDSDDPGSEALSASQRLALELRAGTYAKDLYLPDGYDEEDMHENYDKAFRVLLHTSSFTTPMLNKDTPLDVQAIPTTVVWEVEPNNRDEYVPDLASNFVNHSFHVVSDFCHKATSRKPATAARKRKEVTAAEVKENSKAFLEAKLFEINDWKEKQVYELVDLRKLSHAQRKNYITGRWVLTWKRDKEGHMTKAKARWVLRGF